MANHSNVIDDGALLQIIPTTRKVAVPSTHRVIGTVGDHKSEEITFQCPKIIDGHDVTACAEKYITWQNANGIVGVTTISEVTTDDDSMYFKWLISAGVTAAEGYIKFAVHFVDTDVDNKILYQWSTTTNEELLVLPTIGGGSGGDDDPTYIDPSADVMSAVADLQADTNYSIRSMAGYSGWVRIAKAPIFQPGMVDVTISSTDDIPISELHAFRLAYTAYKATLKETARMVSGSNNIAQARFVRVDEWSAENYFYLDIYLDDDHNLDYMIRLTGGASGFVLLDQIQQVDDSETPVIMAFIGFSTSNMVA